MRTFAAPVVVALLLAGCTRDAAPSDESTSGVPAPAAPPLQGWVFDAALRPVANANVSVGALNLTLRTASDGHYAVSDLVYRTLMVVTVEAPGFVTLSKAIILEPDRPSTLNFTLEAVPVKLAYREQLPFKGFLACMATTTVNGGETPLDCGGDQNTRIWEFHVAADLAGIVIEAYWIPRSELARSLNVTVETVGLGDQDAVLARVEGGSILKAQVSQLQAAKYFPAGGTVRVTVSPGPNVEQEEISSGASVAVQQDFDLIETAFYIDPPSPTFTAVS